MVGIGEKLNLSMGRYVFMGTSSAVGARLMARRWTLPNLLNGRASFYFVKVSPLTVSSMGCEGRCHGSDGGSLGGI